MQLVPMESDSGCSNHAFSQVSAKNFFKLVGKLLLVERHLSFAPRRPFGICHRAVPQSRACVVCRTTVFSIEAHLRARLEARHQSHYQGHKPRDHRKCRHRRRKLLHRGRKPCAVHISTFDSLAVWRSLALLQRCSPPSTQRSVGAICSSDHSTGMMSVIERFIAN